MNFFKRTKLKPQPSSLTLDFSQPNPEPQSDFRPAPRLPSPPPFRPLSVPPLGQPNPQPRRLASRASQSKLSGRPTPISVLQPVSESQDEERGRNNSSRASQRSPPGNRIGNFDTLAEWAGRAQPVSQSQTEDRDGEIQRLQESLRAKQAEIDRAQENLRNALRRLAETDGRESEATGVTQAILQEQEIFAEQARAKESQQQAEIQDLTNKLTARDRQIALLNAKVKRADQMSGDARAQHARFIRDAKDREKHLQDALTDKTKDVVDLTAALEQAKKDHNEAMSKMQADDAQRYLATKRRMEQLHRDMQAADSDRNLQMKRNMEELQTVMQKRIEELDTENKQAQLALKQSKDEARLISLAVDKRHRGEIAQKNELLRQRSAEVAREAANARKLGLQIADLQSHKTQRESRIYELEQNLQNATETASQNKQELLGQIEGLQEQKNENGATIRGLEQQLRDITQAAAVNREELRVQMQVLEEQKNERDTEIQELDRQVREAVPNLQLEIESLELQVQNLRLQSVTTRRDLEQQLQEAQRTAAQERSDSVKAMNELREEKQSGISALTVELEELNSRMGETRLVLNRTRNELTAEKRKATQAVADSAETSRKFEFVQQECASLQQECATLQQEHTNLQAVMREREGSSLRIREELQKMLGTTHV